MASEYPPGAVDQYAAVAAVMRRGRPWQISVFMLLVRGYLPADRGLVRQAYAELLRPLSAGPTGDALDYAEQVAARTVEAGTARPFLRAFERNLRRSRHVLEPGTDTTTAAATGAMATLVLLVTGQPEWSADALIELMAAYGFPVGELSGDERQVLARFATAIADQLLSGAALARVAAEAPLERIQAAVPWARDTTREVLDSISRTFPRPGEDIEDMLTAVTALIHVRTEDLGGDDAIADLATAALPERAAS
jgi:hypothetical protein